MGDKSNQVSVDPRLYDIIQDCITVGVNEGVRRALVEIEKQKEEKKKHKADMRFRNTELLLYNYVN